LTDHWKVHALPNEVSRADQEKRYVLVLAEPDARGLGWLRQIRGHADLTRATDVDGLTEAEARAMARALNAMIRKGEPARV